MKEEKRSHLIEINLEGYKNILLLLNVMRRPNRSIKILLRNYDLTSQLTPP